MSLLSPHSIAVVGASADEGSVGFTILHNLLTQGFTGEVFPVNPKHTELQGKTCYKSLKDIPGEVDMAVIAVPAKIVPSLMKECGAKGVQSVVVISAGFSEVHTKSGTEYEAALIDTAAKYGMHVLGPNCLGILRPSTGMNASFAPMLPPKGNVSLISQSGALAVAMMDASRALGIGYANVISIGNKAVMDEAHLLTLCSEDPETKVIGLYLENVKDGERFYDVASKVAKTKPIILLKAGVSARGSSAASSHTGALAGNDAGIEALVRQTGISRAHTTEEFLDLLAVKSTQPPLLSNRIAIVTNAGGPGILATDAAELAGLELPELSTKVASALRAQLPESASIGNPIDVIGDADATRYKAALDACGDDASIDGVCVLLTPQSMTPCEEVANVISEWKKTFPLMPVVTAFMGDTHVIDAIQILREKGIPHFSTPERAVQALGALRTKTHSEVCHGSTSGMRATRAREILHPEQKKKEQVILSEKGMRELFALYDITLPSQRIAKTAKEALEIADEIGYPVVAKIHSPKILHKTDIGGVRADVQTPEQLEEAFEGIMKNVKKNAPGIPVNGVLIQQFFQAGNEFIVGATRDSAFGPLIMVGLGGIYTELLSDTAFRIAPITQDEGYSMLRELVAWKVLLGMRGKEVLDIDALAVLLEKISQMVTECPEIVEMDLNPVIVEPHAVNIADVKVVIEKK